MPRLETIGRVSAACLAITACVAEEFVDTKGPLIEMPAGDVALYRAAFAALPAPPKGLEGPFSVDRQTTEGWLLSDPPTKDWVCQDGSDPAAAWTRYKAMPPGRLGETLPAEALAPPYELTRELSPDRQKGDGYHGGPRKCEVGLARASALRRSPDGQRAAVYISAVFPEEALVELAVQDGTWRAVGQCGKPIPTPPPSRQRD